MKSRLFLGSTFLFLAACATYQGKVLEARNLIQTGQFDLAFEKLKPLAEQEGNDQLIYLLDYATALQIAKNYSESNKYFIRADRLSEVQDYHSLSRVAGSFVLNEEQIQYKGDDYELVLINAMTAINFLVMNELDSALVEVRRLNEKLNRYRLEADRKFDQNPFAMYLSAIIWEADGKWDDAYIAYEKTFKLAPNFVPLQGDLIRSAKRAGRMDSYLSWKKKFSKVQEDNRVYDKNYGELVVIFQQGWGPRKAFNPENYRYPIMRPVYSQIQMAQIKVEGQGDFISEHLFSARDIAVQSLADQYGELVARRVGGVVTKAIVADQIRQKNEALGDLAWIVLNATDRADLRQWSTLPESFQIVRIPLKAGKYRITVAGLSGPQTLIIKKGQNALPGEEIESSEVEILPRKKVFKNYRSLK